MRAWKVTRLDGHSLHGDVLYVAGHTYIARALRDGEAYTPCSDTVLHASPTPLDALGYSTVGLHVALWEVEGNPVVSDETKSGYASLSVLRRVPVEEEDVLYGFRVSEARQPINPALITPVTTGTRALLTEWVSVRETVRASMASICASLGVSVGSLVWDSVMASVGESVGESVRDSIGESVCASVSKSIRASVWASVWAYIGSLFTGVWRGEYPFASGEELWRRGLIPVCVSGEWRLYHPVVGGPAVRVEAGV